MAAFDRKARAQRTTALTTGCMSEVLLAGTLVIWSGGSPESLGRDALGRGGSFVCVATAMVLLAGGLVILALAARLGRAALKVGMAATALGFGGWESWRWGRFSKTPALGSCLFSVAR
ncbi:hypothetical protein GCM10029964_101060 [Kibdelosporangium lantanae]